MGIDPSAVARVVGIDTQFKDLRVSAALSLPQRIAVVAQSTTLATYPMAPYRITSAQQAALRFGFGSPIHLAARQLFPDNGQGVGSIPVIVIPVEDPVGGTPAAGSITPSGAATVNATYRVRVAGILSAPVAVIAGDTVADICAKITEAINAVLAIPLIATDGTTLVDLEAKWAGTNGNFIQTEVFNDLFEVPLSGLTFTIAPVNGGVGAVDIDASLALLDSPWTTFIVNGFASSETTVLDALQDLGESRWDKLVRRPFVAVVGNTIVAVGSATSGTNGRKMDRVNCQVVAPGSVCMPVQVAAAHVREIAKVADANPPTDYGARSLRTLLPGVDADQWTYAERDLAVKAGSSTIELRDGVVQISDVVTMWHPTGEEPPAYRYVVDIVKLQNIIYNFDLEFSKPEWNGAPLIPDGQPTSNPNARTPKAAKAAACSILDGLGLAAIISDPATAKKNTVASIDAANPKRLNLTTTVQLSGNVNVLSVDLNFGFFFGAPTLVA